MSRIAEELFGKITHGIYRATGDKLPKIENLNQPVEGPDSVAHIFCKGCGTYSEANEKRAEFFLQKLESEHPKDFSGYYFEVKGCDVCDGDREKICLKTIKQGDSGEL